MSSRVISDPNSESRLVLHTKWEKLKLLISLSWKIDFLQMTSNIGKLYTIGKNILSQVWIWDRYLKIRLHLTRIYLQSFCFCTKNHADDLGTFIRNRGYHVEEELELNELVPKSAVKSGRRPSFSHCEEMTSYTCHFPPHHQWLSDNESWPQPFSPFWACWTDACVKSVAGVGQSRMCC